MITLTLKCNFHLTAIDLTHHFTKIMLIKYLIITNIYFQSQYLVSLGINTKKYHVFAPMGRFQLESIYLYFPPSSQLGQKHKYTSWDDGGK